MTKFRCNFKHSAFIYFLLFIKSISAQAPPICFKPVVNYNATGSNLSCVASADFNGDGKPDIATVKLTSSFMGVLINNGSGAFAAAVNYSPGLSPVCVNTGDFNGDGNIDLVTTNGGSNNISIFMGSGTGTFGAAVNYSVGSSPRYVISGDFNADTHADLAIANSGGGGIRILLGNGTGTFGIGTAYGAGTTPYSIALGDFNTDGKIDLAVANQNSNNTSILIGNGNGTFVSAVNYSVGSGPSSIVSADFNGDNKLDLATANFYANSISVLLGSGTGTFATAVDYTVGTQPIAITSADYNLDGKLDIAVANVATNNVSVLKGSGTGTFSPLINFATSGPRGIVSNDFDADGKMDIAVAADGISRVGVFINDLPNISVSSATICSGSSFTISPIGANTYTFIGGGPIVNPATSTTYTVLGSSVLGCTNTALCLVATTTVLSVSSTVNNPTICVGQSAIITASGATTYTWSNLSNSNSITVSPTVTSNYTVTGSTGNCSGISISTVVVNSCTGIYDSNYQSEFNFHFFPNPASNFLNVEVESRSAIKVFDAIGKLIIIKEFQTGVNRMDLTELQNGVYYLQINQDGNVVTRKFIKGSAF